MEYASEAAEKDIENAVNIDGVWFHGVSLTYLCGGNREDELIICKEKCGWGKLVGNLPDDGDTPMQPPFCPACWIDGDVVGTRKLYHAESVSF